MASRILHPGSLVWVQSENLHIFVSSSMSLNVSLMPASAFHIPSSLIPGVSIIIAPLGNIIRFRDVVVCFPRESFSLISDVFIISFPYNVFINVDFPTPDDPRKTIVFPFEKYFWIFSKPSLVLQLIAYTSTPKAIFSTCSTYSWAFGTKSLLVSIITGIPPDSHVKLKYLSIRCKLKLLLSDCIINT